MFKLSIGDRVSFKGEQGVVRFSGGTQFAPGVWIGVELEEPNGKNDGSVNGEKYFSCANKHGIFVRDFMLEQSEANNTSWVSDAGSSAPQRIHIGSSDVITSDDFTDETQRLRAIIQRLQGKLLAMKSNIEKVNDDLGVSESSNSELKDKLMRAEEDLEISAIDKETLEEQNELLNQKIHSLTEQNSIILKDLQSLKEELRDGDTNTSLLNESTKSLINRNKLLENALLKLREHASNEKSAYTEKIAKLESKIEPLSKIQSRYMVVSERLSNTESIVEELRSHIDISIHSSEIIESLTAKNNKLIEENSKLKLSLKELDDLRQVGEELETFHTETESQLQREINKLRDALNSQKNGVDVLEERNIELQNKSEELQALNHQLSQIQRNNHLNNEAQNYFESNDNYKEGLLLKLLIIRTEIEFKEKELDHYKTIVGKSEFIDLRKTSLQLENFSQIYKLLGAYTLDPSADLFIKVLAAKLQLSVNSFSSFLKFAGRKFEYSIGYSEFEINDLAAVTEKIEDCIIEHDYRDIPDLNLVRLEILERVKSMETAFAHRTQFLYDLEQEKFASEFILEIISAIKSSKYEVQIQVESDISKLYHLANERKVFMVGLLQRFEATKVSEISEVDFFRIHPLVSHFIEQTISVLSNLEEGSSLNSEIDLIVQAFKNHENDEIKWEDLDIEQTWFLKSYDDKKVDLHELEELQEELKRSRIELQKKENEIEEVSLKVDVLNSRLVISKDIESQLKRVKEEVKSLKQEKLHMDQRLQGLLISNYQLSSDLQKAKSHALVHNSQFEALYEQKKLNEKSELVSELHSLRNVIKSLTKKHRKQRDWLRVEILERKIFEKTDADKLRLIGRDLRKAVGNVRLGF